MGHLSQWDRLKQLYRHDPILGYVLKTDPVMVSAPTWRSKSLGYLKKAIKSKGVRVAVAGVLVAAGAVTKMATSYLATQDSCGPICKALNEGSDWMIQKAKDVTELTFGSPGQ